MIINSFPKKVLVKLLKKSGALADKIEKTGPVQFVLPEVLCKEPPSNQTAADIFKHNWLAAFPPQYNVTAGAIEHFDFAIDPRVKWTDEVTAGGLQQSRILELGPFEGYNTWQMEQLGAAQVTAVENNKVNFLKCLVVKEITGLKARFLLGDFIAYLEQSKELFDFVWASGVLYHQVEPLKLLSLITAVTSKLFIHTHYYDDEKIMTNPDVRGYFHPDRNVQGDYDGFGATLHYRSYQKEKYTNAIYSGGPNRFSYWLEKKDILTFLKQKGFTKITVEIDDKEHLHGPGICFLAEKEALTS